MKQEFNIFLNALMFYTRIPVPKSVIYSETALSKAFRYFPLIGIIVGAAGAGCLILANMVMPYSLSVLLAISVMVLLTGGIHEDGIADFFDGFGGGRSKESILRIMRDSHIGTYGVVTLILLIAFKYTALTAIPIERAPLVLICAHTISRVFPILMVRISSYARGDESKSQHTRQGIDTKTLVIAILFGVIPLSFMGYIFTAIYITVSAIILMLLRLYLHRKIGGFTGDTLGALQQFTELCLYLTYLSLPATWTELSIW